LTGLIFGLLKHQKDLIKEYQEALGLEEARETASKDTIVITAVIAIKEVQVIEIIQEEIPEIGQEDIAMVMLQCLMARVDLEEDRMFIAGIEWLIGMIEKVI